MQVVVPVKSFKHAKKRLSAVLTAGQRCDLMKHMLADVLSAVALTPEVEAITVVSSDAEVEQWVDKRALSSKTPLRVFDPSAEPLETMLGDEPGLSPINKLAEAGLCQAYSAAAANLMAQGVSTMLLLPADIPLVTRADIQALVAQHTCPGVSVAAAGSDGGTNALLVSPPDIIAPAFGDNSCQRHIALAREQGLEPAVLNTPGLSLDIDTVEDIHALLAAGRECATLRFLVDSGIAVELAKSAPGGQLQSTKFRQSGQQNQTNRHVG
ncbi:MAG: 2-phospho-L-lactate guanylyltransferase [Gammaproteobacteria bacterium]|nr:2-phospho-L-lactate guanylyltransferase [Gammaproteobacteria bacterium]MBQ0839917.1 2-phospho-L-lactate guanylyltransferase [Gammaproteobacteria bacterium]